MANPRNFDVLVLGSGIAGLFYALRIADDARVAIVTKKRAADSATNWAQGGIAAVHSDDDSFASHSEDTLNAGAGLCRPEVVEHVVERGPRMIEALLALGASPAATQDVLVDSGATSTTAATPARRWK